MKEFYGVMRLQTVFTFQDGDALKNVNLADGQYILPVFETEDMAKAYSGGQAEIVRIGIRDKNEDDTKTE